MKYDTVALVPVSTFGRCQVDGLWSFDRAVLTKVVETYEPTGVDLLSSQVLRHFPAKQHDDVRQSLRRLDKDGYTETAALRRGNGEVQFLRINGVTGKGLRASGAWPDDAELLADRILAALFVVAPVVVGAVVHRLLRRGSAPATVAMEATGAAAEA